jgi:hypothetical protein
MEHLLRMPLADDVAQVRSRSDEIKVARYTPEGALGFDPLLTCEAPFRGKITGCKL